MTEGKRKMERQGYQIRLDMDQFDMLAVEREARRMQAKVMRDMLRGLANWIGRRAAALRGFGGKQPA